MLPIKIKVLIDTIDKTNHKKAIKYCRAISISKDEDRAYATQLYETIKKGNAKIYFYEDGTWDYKIVK